MNDPSVPPAMSSAAPPRNDLGLAGFIVSLVGLVTAGLLSPIGLVISLVALGREPKGFAIAGVILGILGSCGILIGMFFFGAAILAMLGIAGVAAALALTQGEKLEVTADMAQVAAIVERYRDANGRLPADLEEAGVPASLRRDPWGVGYRIEPMEGEPGFDVRSAGEDTIFDSEDDVRLSALDRLWGTGDGPFRVETSREGGRTSVRFGDLRIEVEGEGENARVVVRSGDGEVIEVDGDSVQVGPGDGPAPEGGDAAGSGGGSGGDPGTDGADPPPGG